MSLIYLALFIPIIVTTVFYLYKKHKFTWWEFFIPLIITLISIVISKVIIE